MDNNENTAKMPPGYYTLDGEYQTLLFDGPELMSYFNSEEYRQVMIKERQEMIRKEKRNNFLKMSGRNN